MLKLNELEISKGIPKSELDTLFAEYAITRSETTKEQICLGVMQLAKSLVIKIYNPAYSKAISAEDLYAKVMMKVFDCLIDDYADKLLLGKTFSFSTYLFVQIRHILSQEFVANKRYAHFYSESWDNLAFPDVEDITILDSIAEPISEQIKTKDKIECDLILHQYGKKLPYKYLRILKLKLFEEKTYTEISEMFHISKQRVHQEFAEAVRKLKELVNGTSGTRGSTAKLKINQDDVAKLLPLLPSKRKLIAQEYFINKKTAKQISQEFNQSQNSVYTQIKLAKRTLAAHITDTSNNKAPEISA